MHDDNSRKELEKVQLQAALLRLSEANNQIARMELQQRFDGAGSEARAYQLAELVRKIESSNDGNNLFPAYILSQVWQTTNIAEKLRVWRRSCDALGIDGTLATLAPHDDDADPITILVRGSGGYGDMLYLSMIVRGLYYHFNRPRIIVVHEHPGVKSIFDGNPYVIDARQLPGEQGHRFFQLAAAMDVFDLVADVRYAVSYLAPPRSRIEGDFLAQANTRSMVWQNYVRRDWPFLNNIFAKEVVGKGFSKYNFCLYTANITSQLGNFGDFMVAQTLETAVTGLLDRPYVTIHHGADRNMSGANGLQTKNLPISKWLDVVARVKAAGLLVAQLGEAHEQLVDGVDADLRGKCSLAQSAMVLRHAQVHIDTEGGLVHVARAVGTPSVVAFGPTSLPFFGYPENINVAAKVCGDCWWTSRDWSVRCPRELPAVMCMESHSGAGLAASAVELSKRFFTLCYVSHRVNTATTGGVTEIEKALPGGGRGAVIGASAALLGEAAHHGIVRDDVRTFALNDAFALASPHARHYPATWQRVPLDSATLDWVVCAVDDRSEPIDMVALASLLFECARIVEQGQVHLVLDLAGSAISTAALEQALVATIGGRMEATLTGAPEKLASGTYTLSVEPRKKTHGGAALQRAMTKPMRTIDALAANVMSRRGRPHKGARGD